MNKTKALFKFNSGAGALCCSKCNVIIKTAYQFSDEEMSAMKGEGELEAQYCEKCKENYIEDLTEFYKTIDNIKNEENK